MKPITNILLIGALVCYVFLPFCTVPLVGNSMTGPSLSVELITGNFSLTRTIMALLPFVSLFCAIVFNCLRSRYWGLASGVCIIAALAFFIIAGNEMNNTLPMTHAPELAPADMHEGFEIEGKAIGYKLGYLLTWIALLSCIVSLMPFRFNMRLEQQIDGTLERQLLRGKKQWNRMEQELHHMSKTPKQTGKADASQTEPASLSKKAENPLDYMPADQRSAQVAPEPTSVQAPDAHSLPEDKEDNSRFMPH